MRRLALAVSLPPLLLLLAAGCDRRAAPAAEAEPPKPVAKPVSAPPPAEERKGWLGVVVARESVDVTADSQGRVQAIYVSIGDRVKTGMAVSVEPYLTIGSDCLIASGCAITGDVPAGSLVKAQQGYVVRPLPAKIKAAE